VATDEKPARGVRVAAPDEPPAPDQTRRATLTWWVWPAALAVAAVVLFFCYWRLSSTIPDNSDGSDQALQAWDMWHGNWLLSGWIVGDVSYYTTEIPEYILVELVRGLGPDVIHISAAITYTLLVLAAGLLAKGRASGREGLVRMLIGSGIMLTPQLGNGVHVLIQQPDHIGTQLPLLIIFMVLDRAPRRWFTPVAIAVMLTWVVISDRVAVFDAALPLVAVGGLRALAGLISAGNVWARGRWRNRLAELWFELSLAAAGIVSFVAAEVVVHLIKAAGGYTSLPLPSQVMALHTLPHHVAVTAKGILLLYGADFTHGMSAGAVVMAVIHLAGVILALWAFFLAFRRFFSTSDLIIPVLATGIVFNLGAYFLSSVPATWFDTREIAAVLPFGAVLAGRQLAEPLCRARLEPLLAGVLTCYVVMLGYGAAQSPVADTETPVVGWLEAHHLTTGLGTYTEANLITLDSGGRVAIRTVTWRHSGAVPRAYESELSWYNPKLHYANFVVENRADGGRTSVIPQADLIALAGPPAQTYHYRTFTIMVWNKNLLSDLGHPPSAFPGDIP
jgi:hypothetical protein